MSYQTDNDRKLATVARLLEEARGVLIEVLGDLGDPEYNSEHLGQLEIMASRLRVFLEVLR